MTAGSTDSSEAGRVEFARRVTAVVRRGLAQIGRPPLSDDEAGRLAEVLAQIGAEGGWARRAGEGELAGAEVAAWVGRLTAVAPGRATEFAGLVKQLVKACFQPAPGGCRDSFVETDGVGRCRRQELAYDLARISGAHCVDCPHWTEFTAAVHASWLGERWHAGVEDLHGHCGVFLPEDFRALRGWRP